PQPTGPSTLSLPDALPIWTVMAAPATPLRDPVFTDWQLPTFSMEERDRRWGRVRELMRRDGVDCIVGLNSTGTHNRNQADVRYLDRKSTRLNSSHGSISYA